MIFFGLAEIIGGIASGGIIHKIGHRYSLYILYPLTFLTYLGSVVAILDSINWDWYIVCFLWGLMDSFSNVLNNSILQIEFEEEIE